MIGWLFSFMVLGSCGNHVVRYVEVPVGLQATMEHSWRPVEIAGRMTGIHDDCYASGRYRSPDGDVDWTHVSPGRNRVGWCERPGGGRDRLIVVAGYKPVWWTGSMVLMSVGRDTYHLENVSIWNILGVASRSGWSWGEQGDDGVYVESPEGLRTFVSGHGPCSLRVREDGPVVQFEVGPWESGGTFSCLAVEGAERRMIAVNVNRY